MMLVATFSITRAKMHGRELLEETSFASRAGVEFIDARRRPGLRLRENKA